MAIKLDNTLNVESRLPIEPLINKTTKAEIHDGIPFVKLVRVEVIKTVHEKGEYAGLEVPELQLEFINHKLNADEEDRFLLLREKTVHSKTLMSGSETEYVALEPKLVDDLTQSMYSRIKHIHDAYSFSPNFVSFAKMTKKEVTEYFNLPSVEDNMSPEERIEAFTKFFEFIAGSFNGKRSGEKGEPIFKDGNSFYVMRLKVVAEYKKGNYFTVPTYVGQGFIEKAINKDGKWQSPRRVSKRPNDKFELTPTKSKSAILKELENANQDTESLLNDMDI